MKKFVFFVALIYIGFASTEDAATETSTEPITAIPDVDEPALSVSSTTAVTSAATETISTSTENVVPLLDTSISTSESPIPTTAATSTSASFFSTEKQRPSKPTSTPLPSIATTVRTTSFRFSTTEVPKIVRSRGRQVKKLDNSEQQPQPQLVPLKIIKSDASEARSASNTGIKIRSKKPVINILQSDVSPQLIRNQKASNQNDDVGEKVMKISEKADKSDRRGKVRYLTGKELGRDAPPINFRSKYEKDKFGFSYETKDGQLRFENGVFENMGTEEQNYIVKGSYSYFDDEGIEYIVNYTADNRGYHPVITVNNPNRA